MLLQYDWKRWFPKRGEVYLVDLGDTLDSEEAGVRPFLILSNNTGNKSSSIVIGMPISSRKKCLPMHVYIRLKTDSYILTEQIRTVSKRRFVVNGKIFLLATLSESKVIEVENAVRLSLGFIS